MTLSELKDLILFCKENNVQVVKIGEIELQMYANFNFEVPDADTQQWGNN